jgi:D-sedoheptulose 7-phosphate isomerase
MIKTIIFDIDGVFTDGAVTIAEDGKESKTLDFRDIDAFFSLKRAGYKTAFITGESTPIVFWFKDRFQPDYFIPGCKDKKIAVTKIKKLEKNTNEQVCYIGDSRHDLPGLKGAGFKVCPQNAAAEVKLQCDIVLSCSGGKGAIAELASVLAGAHRKKSDFEIMFNKSTSDHLTTIEKIITDRECIEKIQKAADIILKAYQSGNKLLLCGNGGSAADSQHIATELVSRFFIERKALDAETLTANTSTLTAIGNDYSFDNIFSRQIEAKGKKGDALLGFTTSGTSKNVLQAFETGKSIGISCICLSGIKTNKKLSEICDVVIYVPSEIVPRIQEAHIMIGHILCEYIERSIFGEKQ